MLIGMSVVVTGLVFVWKAVQAAFRDQIAAHSGKRVWIVALRQFGYVTRGVVFALIGIFLMRWRPRSMRAGRATSSTISLPLAGASAFSTSWMTAIEVSR
jgi:hypothetical protein